MHSSADSDAVTKEVRKKALDDFRAFFARTSMYIPNTSYDSHVSFLEGYDYAMARAVLGEFDHWLKSEHGAPGNLHWSRSVLYLLHLPLADPYEALQTRESEKLAVAKLQTLVEEFLSARR